MNKQDLAMLTRAVFTWAALGYAALGLLFACTTMVSEPVKPLPPSESRDVQVNTSTTRPGFAPAKGYWVEVTSITQSMETIAIFLPSNTTQAEDVAVISQVVEEIQKNGKDVLVFICLAPEEAVFVLPNISCQSLYWFPVTKNRPQG